FVGAFYTDAQKTKVAIGRISQNGLVLEKTRLQGIKHLSGGHTMVTKVSHAYVLGYQDDPAQQILVRVDAKFNQHSVRLTDTACALLKFGQAE
ncbi:MAG: hypothetical protein K1X79_10300, partial [Oligoflexia bacterium]|nr:hypothetical protein [Oligoflexia bacterium]